MAGLKFGGIDATDVVGIDANTVEGTTPAHAYGFVDVAPTFPDGTSGTAPQAYHYDQDITFVTPPDFTGYDATWLEIEGIPYAFGFSPKPYAYFDDRIDRYKRLGIKGVLTKLPSGVDQEARPLEGDSSIGQLSVQLQMTPDVRALVANTLRADLRLRLQGDLPSVLEANIDVPVSLTCTGWVDTGPGTGYDAAYAWNNGILYIGRETVTYQSREIPVGGVVTFNGVKRMRFEVVGHTGCYSHSASDIVTPYPRMVATRRALYRVAKPDGGSIARWAGIVTDAKSADNLGAVDLSIDSADREVKVRRFGGQVRGKLKLGITESDGSYDQGASGVGPATANWAVLEHSSIDGRPWGADERVIVRVDDEYMSVRLKTNAPYEDNLHFDTAGGTAPADARGLFGSQAAQHDAGAEVIEVLWTGAYDANGAPEAMAARFTRGDNPVDLVLQILLSRNGDGSNGYYDVLPFGFGLGIDQARVDVAACLKVRDSWLATARHLEIIEEPFNAKDKIAEILRPHLCYLITTPDDRFVVKRVAPPLPGDAVRIINADNALEIPGFDGNLVNGVYGRVKWRCDYDPVKGDYRQLYTGEFTDAQELYAGQFKTLDVDAKGQWSGNDAGTGRFGAALATDAELAARRYIDEVRARYSLPFPVLSIECDFDAVDAACGDLVRVTLDNLPNVETGGVGIADAFCEVIQKTAQDETGKVELVVTQTGYRGAFRRYAPSARIDAVIDASTFTVFDHEFTNPLLADLVDGDFFKVGDKIAVWDTRLYDMRGVRTIVAKPTRNTIVLDSVLAYAGYDTIMPDAYAGATQAQRDAVGFLDAGHTYTG